MSDRIDALRLFVRVAQTESFSRAGRELGLSQPSVSRIISSLEHTLGTPLLTRTTRAVVLTEAGTEYLVRVQPILQALEEADSSLRKTGELRGVLKVALPSSLALRSVIPGLKAFMDRHPTLRVQLRIDDQRRDLLRDGADVALRMVRWPTRRPRQRGSGATSEYLRRRRTT